LGVATPRDEALDEETSCASGQDIYRAVRVSLEYSVDLHATSHLRVISISGEENSELPFPTLPTFIETILHHRFVSRLVDSKGYAFTGKYDEGEGEDGKWLLRHTSSISWELRGNEANLFGQGNSELTCYADKGILRKRGKPTMTRAFAR
jgi:hypothetical protein